MSLQWILGRVATGKTTRLLDDIAHTWKRNMSTNPMWLIVPEQMVYDVERRLTMQFGALMHVHVVSFQRLAERVAVTYGGATRTAIDDTGKAMVLTHVLQHLSLRTAKKGWRWATHVLEAAHECMQSCVTTNDLREWAQHVAQSTLQTKLHELADVLDEMNKKMSQQRRVDGAHLRDLARTILTEPSLAGAYVWIDGFHGFTPAEEHVLKALLLRQARVTIALTLPGPVANRAMLEEVDWFARPARTYWRVEQLARDAHCTIESPMVLYEGQALSPALQTLERQWVEEGSAFGRAPVALRSLCVPSTAELPPLTVYEAAHGHAEIEALARYIDECVRSGVRYRDIAVITRQWDEVKSYIENVFPLFHIPYYIDEKQSATHHPLALLIDALFEIVISDGSSEPIFRAMKTQLFISPPPEYTDVQWRDVIDRFEQAALWIGLRGDRWFSPLPAAAEPYASDVAIEQCRQWLCARLERIHRWAQSTTMRAWANGLWSCLEEWDVDCALERLSIDEETGAIDAVHETMWNSVCDMLEQMIELMGDDEADLLHFADVLRGGVQRITLGTVPPSLDHVLIAHVDRSRLPRVRVVCWAGLNDGVMPAKRRDGGWLAECERQELTDRFGDVLGPDQARILREEPYLFYVHAFVASEALWVGTHRIDSERSSCRPSEWIDRLRRWMPDHIAGRDETPQWHSDRFALHHVRTVEWTKRMLTTALHEAGSGQPIHGVWWAVYNALSDVPMHALSDSVGTEQLSLAATRALYGTTVRTSVSQLETYALCAFSHFAKYALRLQERKRYRIERPDIGLIAHEALSAVVSELIDQGATLRTVEADVLRSIMERHVQTHIESYRLRLFASTGRARHMATLIERLLVRTLLMMQRQEQAGQFVPLATEVVFGANGPLPPLTLSLSGRAQLVLTGRIDRIDVADVGDRRYVRVIDYKSRAKKLHWNDVWHGISLQLLTYAHHVETAGPDAWHTPWVVAGALYMPVHDPMLSMNSLKTPEKCIDDTFKKYKMRGVLRKDGASLAAMDGLSPKSSPIIPVTWRDNRQQLALTGAASMELLDATQWDTWVGFLRQKITTLGERLYAGDIAVHPQRTTERTLACQLCSMQAVCQFDSERHRAREQRYTTADVWERMSALVRASASGGKDEHSDDDTTRMDAGTTAGD